MCLTLLFSCFMIFPSVGHAEGSVGSSIHFTDMSLVTENERTKIALTFTSGRMVGKEEKPKPMTSKGDDIEQICGTLGDARWCACKTGIE